MPARAADAPVTRPARGRGRPPRISRDDLVAAAIDVGLDTFSMQAVADRVGVSSPALYSHVSGRDELRGLAHAELHRRLAAFSSPAEDWRGWLVDFAHLVRAQVPGSSGTLLDRLGTTGTGGTGGQVLLGERGLHLLIDAGLPPVDAGYVVWLVFRIAATPGDATEQRLAGYIGTTGQVLGPADPPPAADDEPDADADVLPATRAVFTALTAASHDTFAFDLELVLAGVEARLRPPTRSNQPQEPT